MTGHHTATLVISPGRSGTQWLASTLRALYSDLAVVTHEPLEARYRTAEYLRQFDEPEAILSLPEVAAHVDRVAGILMRRDYIETGWPAMAAIPLFIARFPGAVRLVELVRHPVPTAMSMTTFGYYLARHRASDWARHAVLRPDARGTKQKSYSAGWEGMSTYEKSLYHWTETHLFGDDVAARYPGIPYLRTRYEDIFDPSSRALEELVEFLGLPPRAGLREAAGRTVDKYQFAVSEDIDWRRIEAHPETMRLLGRHGYSLETVDEKKLRARYVSSALPLPPSVSVWKRGWVHRLRRSEAFRRLYWPVRDRSLVSPGWMLVARELLRLPGLGIYRIRESGTWVSLRSPHGDLWEFDDVFRRCGYELPPAAQQILAGLARCRVLDLGAGPGLVSVFLLSRVAGTEVVSWTPHARDRVAIMRTIAANRLEDRWRTIDPVDDDDLYPHLEHADLIRLNLGGGEWSLLQDRRFVHLDARAVVVDYNRRFAPREDLHSAVSDLLAGAGYSVRVSRADQDSGRVWAWKGPE